MLIFKNQSQGADVLCNLSNRIYFGRIMTGLSGGENAVSLISVDFSKAFNRMEHQTCLVSLARKGASTDTIQMVGSFLTGQGMKIKLDGTYSKPREMKGGAPQGTKMGNLLFSVTIDEIEVRKAGLDFCPPEVHKSDEPEVEQDEDQLGLRRMAREMSEGPIARINSGVAVSTPYKHHAHKGVIRYHDESGRPTATEDNCQQFGALDKYNMINGGHSLSTWTDKFVDDVTGCQMVPISQGSAHISTVKEKRNIHATENKELFNVIQTNAEEIKMLVNPKKTSASLH